MQRILFSSQNQFHFPKSRKWSQNCLRVRAWSYRRSQQTRSLTQSPCWNRRVSTPDPKSPLQNVENPEAAHSPESIKPETFKKPGVARADNGPNTDNLLSEQTVSNKEQRKADWAIIKEMAQYLWPKVGPGALREIGINLMARRMTWAPKLESVPHWPYWLARRCCLLLQNRCMYVLKDSPGPKCSSPILLQKHRGFYEH